MKEHEGSRILNKGLLAILLLLIILVTVYITGIYILPKIGDNIYINKLTDIGDIESIEFYNLYNDEYKYVSIYKEDDVYYATFDLINESNNIIDKHIEISKDKVNDILYALNGYLSRLNSKRETYYNSLDSINDKKFVIIIKTKVDKGYAINSYSSTFIKPDGYDELFEMVENTIKELDK